MFGPWPWYVGGVVLAVVVLGHGLVLRRLLQGSGRVSALVDRVRLGASEDEALSPEELLASLEEETARLAASLGVEMPNHGPEASTQDEQTRAASELRLAPQPRPLEHLAFFVGLALGGLGMALWSGAWSPTMALSGVGLERAFDGFQIPALLIGGLFVGFGTRMCGGCTAGHGLCGLGRMQPGSALATAAFFGGGVLVARILEAVWS